METKDVAVIDDHNGSFVKVTSFQVKVPLEVVMLEVKHEAATSEK